MFLILAAAGAGMFISGRLYEKFSIRSLALTGAFTGGLSLVLAGYAVNINHIYIWSLLLGIFASLTYLPAVSLVQAWFGKSRGLASGLVNLAFALSAAVMSPLFHRLLQGLGYRNMCILLAIACTGLCLVALPWLKPAPQSSPQSPTAGQGPGSITPAQAFRKKSFWALWSSWVLAGAGGVAMVTLGIQFGLFKGLSMGQAVLILTVFNLANGLSRPISGYISDRISRRLTLGVSFAAAGIAYLLLNQVTGTFFWAFFAGIIGLSFGTLFAVSAPLAVECFGIRHFSSIFGLIFTGYGFGAAALGPGLAGYLLDLCKNDFDLVFGYLGLCSLMAAVLVNWVRR
jgi:OFA family oxalate/formate antiporter-like MFS transporter